MQTKLSELVMAQAAIWHARLRAPDCDATERRRFQAWLAEDAAHLHAYDQVEHMAELVTQQGRVDPRLQALAAQALDSKVVEAKATAASSKLQLSRTSWRVAATLLLSVGVAVLWGALRNANQETIALTAASYSNTEAQQQRIELSDGSIVNLDVNSQINVQMSQSERRIELLKGRAYFEVAHDVTRPFSVGAAGVRTVALGTHFQVALAAHAVSVTLQEGSVAINNLAGTNNWRELLRPGQQLKFDTETGVKQMREVDALAVTGWSNGRLVFDGTPLAEALEEINRYAAVKIRLGDDALAALPIGGNFVAGGDSEQVVNALMTMLPLRVVRVGASEVVLFQRYQAAAN